jgi:hypothetical protein
MPETHVLQDPDQLSPVHDCLSNGLERFAKVRAEHIICEMRTWPRAFQMIGHRDLHHRESLSGEKPRERGTA